MTERKAQHFGNLFSFYQNSFFVTDTRIMICHCQAVCFFLLLFVFSFVLLCLILFVLCYSLLPWFLFCPFLYCFLSGFVFIYVFTCLFFVNCRYRDFFFFFCDWGWLKGLFFSLKTGRIGVIYSLWFKCSLCTQMIVSEKCFILLFFYFFFSRFEGFIVCEVENGILVALIE